MSISTSKRHVDKVGPRGLGQIMNGLAREGMVVKCNKNNGHADISIEGCKESDKDSLIGLLQKFGPTLMSVHLCDDGTFAANVGESARYCELCWSEVVYTSDERYVDAKTACLLEWPSAGENKVFHASCLPEPWVMVLPNLWDSEADWGVCVRSNVPHPALGKGELWGWFDGKVVRDRRRRMEDWAAAYPESMTDGRIAQLNEVKRAYSDIARSAMSILKSGSGLLCEVVAPSGSKICSVKHEGSEVFQDWRFEDVLGVMERLVGLRMAYRVEVRSGGGLSVEYHLDSGNEGSRQVEKGKSVSRGKDGGAARSASRVGGWGW